MYINSKSIYKSFTIRKLISTRNSLFSLECDEKYDKLDPVISFGENEINFTSKDISYVSKDFEHKIPTQEEIESAKQYDDKIFKIESKDKKSDNLKMKFKGAQNDNNNNLEYNLEDGLLP